MSKDDVLFPTVSIVKMIKIVVRLENLTNIKNTGYFSIK